jgi:hypothetical protein
MCGSWRNSVYVPMGTLICLLSSLFVSADEGADLSQRAMQVGYAVKPALIDRGIVNQFLPKEFVYKTGLHNAVQNIGFDQRTFRYRLHVPEQLDDGVKYPLIVWLHGCGDERGWDNTSQLQYMEKTIFNSQSSGLAEYYVLVPQCPLVPGEWFKSFADSQRTVENAGNDMLTVVNGMIDKSIAENPIDPNFVTVVGLSCSASACLELAVRYPNKFAALAPLSLGGIPNEQIAILPRCPIWIFNNSFDDYMDEPSLQQMASSIVAANNNGSNIAQTLVHEREWKHDSWSVAFQQYELLTWLLQQHRGQQSWSYPPGVKPVDWPWRQPLRDWTTMQLLTETAFVMGSLILVGYICYRAEILKTRGRGIPRMHHEHTAKV